MNAIAFFSDMPMLPGLHVALATLLRSLHKHEETAGLAIHVFLDGVPSSEFERLRETHRLCQTDVPLECHAYSPRLPPGAKSIHGNTTAYGPLYLAELLPEVQHCLYLDTDVYVNRSIGELLKLADSETLVLADGSGIREKDLDWELFAAAGLDLSGPCFNSGVMCLNLDLWRQRSITELCYETAATYTDSIKSADQPLLNAALHDSFRSVGDDWNTKLYPSDPPLAHLEDRIYHFVGSPKPWDFLGKHLNNHYPIWQETAETTALGNQTGFRYLSLDRSLRIGRQAFRAWRQKHS